MLTVLEVPLLPFASRGRKRPSVVINQGTVVDIGRFEHGLLGFVKFFRPFRQAGFVHAAGVMHVLRGVPVEQRAALSLPLPGQRAVGRGLVEDHQVAGLHGHVVHDVLVGLVAGNVVRKGEVRLVAARDDAQPAVAGIHVGQLVLAVDQSATHGAVLVVVEAGSVELGLSVPVEAQSLGPRRGREDEWAVVHLPPPAQQGVQIRDDLRIGQHLAKRPAPGLLPRQHPLVEAAKLLALQRPARAARRIVLPLVAIGVQGRVQRADLRGRERVAHHDEPLQVEEVLLMGFHGGEWRGWLAHAGLRFRFLPVAGGDTYLTRLTGGRGLSVRAGFRSPPCGDERSTRHRPR